MKENKVKISAGQAIAEKVVNQTAVVPAPAPTTEPAEVKPYTATKAVEDTIALLTKQGPMDYRDIVTARGHEIALLPPVTAGIMLRKKINNRFVYYLPKQDIEHWIPTPPPAKPATIATIPAKPVAVVA